MVGEFCFSSNEDNTLITIGGGADVPRIYLNHIRVL